MTVGVQQDSGSIKGLSECQFFFSVSRLTVNCEESDSSLVNCHIVCFFGAWGSVVIKALRCKSGCPAIDYRWDFFPWLPTEKYALCRLNS